MVELAVAPDILGHIGYDLCEYEERRGYRPEKIFVSCALFRLLSNYNRVILFDYSCPDSHSARLMGVPVQVYHPMDSHELSYHIALPGRKF